MDNDGTQDTHNPYYATVKRWSVMFACRCGMVSSLYTETKPHIRHTCRQCGTVWEVGPSLFDSTHYEVAQTEDSDHA